MSAYEEAIAQMQNGEYHEAANGFTKSYADGYMPWESLLYYSNCKFMLAGQLPGRGILTGIPRRSLLISASKALRDGLQMFGDTSAYLHLACCVEYALGILCGNNSGSIYYDTYYERLESLDRDMLEQLHSDLPYVKSSFS